VPINPPLQRPTTVPGSIQRPTTAPGAVAINPPLQRQPTLPGPIGSSAASPSGARPPAPPTIAPRAAAPSIASPTAATPPRTIAPPPPPAAAPRVGDLSDDRFAQIYSKYVETRRERNEPTHAITREALAKQLGESTARLRQKHGGKPIDFEVVVKDGKTILRPVVK
jgi:hypothetical protein